MNYKENETGPYGDPCLKHVAKEITTEYQKTFKDLAQDKPPEDWKDTLAELLDNGTPTQIRDFVGNFVLDQDDRDQLIEIGKEIGYNAGRKEAFNEVRKMIGYEMWEPDNGGELNEALNRILSKLI